MLAITHARYGGPEVLEVSEIPTPKPGPGQVLIRVRSASINAADYRMMRANPSMIRLVNGFFGPKKWPVLGSDVAGEVVEVGDGVVRLQVGDAVFGDAFEDGRGTFADYVCVSESALAKKPHDLSFDEAAAVPLAGLTALQGIRDAAEVKEGTRLLIYGAGGGVGGFAVQIAKALGAHVTAVCGPRSVASVRDFGADEVIDYTQEDFAKLGRDWDAIVSVNGERTMNTYRKALVPGGRLVVIGGTNRQIFACLLWAPILFAFDSRSAMTLHLNKDTTAADMEQLAELCTLGKLSVTLDRSWPMNEVADAMRYVERGHVSGKVVLKAA